MALQSLVFSWLYLGLALSVLAEEKVIFTPDYSLHERPPTKEGEPLVIKSSINLRNILDVKEKEQIISLETTLRLYWKVEFDCPYSPLPHTNIVPKINVVFAG